MKAYRGCLLVIVVLCGVWIQHADTGILKSDKAKDQTKRFYLLAIGISDYASVPDLCCAAADANAMAEALQSGAASLYTKVDSVKLLDQQATKAGILQAVQQAAGSLDANDTFLFYFAGHGQRDKAGMTYLVPHEVPPSDPDKTAPLISPAELQAVVDNVRANDRLLLFDSNYFSLGFVGGDGRGQHVLQAAGPGHTVTETQTRDHGRFTAMLLQGLAGQADTNQDGRVSILELASFVGQRLPESESGDQVPAISLYGPDFLLVGKPAESTPQGTVKLEDKLDTELTDLITIYEAKGSEGLQAYGVTHQLDLKGDKVHVKIIAVSEKEVDALKQRITSLGGTVETGFENNLYATLPVPALKQFAMQQAIWRIDMPRQVVLPPGGMSAPKLSPAPAETPRAAGTPTKEK